MVSGKSAGSYLKDFRPRQSEGKAAVAEGFLLLKDSAHECRLLDVARSAGNLPGFQFLRQRHGAAGNDVRRLPADSISSRCERSRG